MENRYQTDPKVTVNELETVNRIDADKTADVKLTLSIDKSGTTTDDTDTTNIKSDHVSTDGGCDVVDNTDPNWDNTYTSPSFWSTTLRKVNIDGFKVKIEFGDTAANYEKSFNSSGAAQ